MHSYGSCKCHKYLLEECKEGATRLFAAISSNIQYGEWAQIEIQEIPFKHTEKLFFTMKVGKECNRLPKGVVESPFSKLLGAQLDIVQSVLLLLTVLWAVGLGYMISRSPF